MIIKGNIRTDGKALGDYLLSEGRYRDNREKNERIEIWEAPGVEAGDDLREILNDFQNRAARTKCKKPLFHVQLRVADDESLTREQWLEAINRLEERLELAGHERAIVTHDLNGHEHIHVVWNRINPDKNKAADLHYFKHKCTDLARDLEKEFGLRVLSDNRKRGSLSRDEEQQALRHGKSPQQIKEDLRLCWEASDNGKSFAASLKEFGYMLAQGDRRDFVIVGPEGDVYGVARETGSKAAQVRAKLADLDRENLPTVEAAKAIQEDRASVRDLLKWEDELAKAAIEKARQEEQAEKQRQAQEKQINISADLSKTAGEIRLAYGLTHSGQGFANALEDRGLILAHVSAEDARNSERAQKAAKDAAKDKAPPIFTEGELVVVNGYGSIYRLNQRTTGHAKAEVEHYLKTVDRSELFNVADAQAVMREVQQHQAHEREIVLNADLSKTAGEIRLAYGLTRSGQGFANALEDRGLILAHVSAEDARNSEVSQKAAKAIGKDKAPPILTEGELVVVNGYGSIYRLNQRTTGHAKAEVEHYLKTVDRSELLNVADAQAVMQEAKDKRLGDWELKKKLYAARRGAKLYDRADMVSMQRDAMRHLKDMHLPPEPMHPDEHRRRQEQDRARQDEAQRQEKEAKDVRRDFWQEMRSLRRTAREQASEDKKDRTEQTEYQKWRAQRDALREESDALRGRTTRGIVEEGREREKER